MKQTKVIGLIGGMSWESTITYYQVINETVKEALGGLHSLRYFSTAWILRRLRRVSLVATGRRAQLF